MSTYDDADTQGPRPIFLDSAPIASQPAMVRTRRKVRRPKPRSRVARMLVLGVLAYGAVAAAMLVVGVLALRDAQNHLGGARAELAVGDLTAKQTPQSDAVVKAMGRAHAMFDSPVVAPLRLAPVLGRQLRAIGAMTDASRTAIRVGIEARRDASELLTRVPRDGADRLALLTAAGDIARDSVKRLDTVDLGPSQNLLSPIAHTRATFAEELNRLGEALQRADTGTAGLAQFLEGPTRYAVFAANNAEMRAGSGMGLMAGTLEVTNGEVRLGPMKSILDLPAAPNDIALEYDYLRLWGAQAPGSDYRFANMTPRFPTSGSLLKRMWDASGAGDVDGVMLVDPVAVKELLSVTGDITLDGRRISAKNALSLFLNDQYAEFDNTKITARRDFLSGAVTEVFSRVNAARVSPNDLGAALAKAAAGRHVLAWAEDVNVQRGWNALGMDGALPDDSVMFALQNRGGTKLDYFQRVNASAKAQLSRDDSRITMNFVITNAVPDGEPTYVAGPVNGSYVRKKGTYAGVAAINIPKYATNVRFTGGDEAGGDYDLVSGRDGNTQVVSKWVEIDAGETLRLTLQFSLPPGERSLTILPSAREPAVFWHLGSTIWHDTSARIIRW